MEIFNGAMYPILKSFRVAIIPIFFWAFLILIKVILWLWRHYGMPVLWYPGGMTSSSPAPVRLRHWWSTLWRGMVRLTIWWTMEVDSLSAHLQTSAPRDGMQSLIPTSMGPSTVWSMVHVWSSVYSPFTTVTCQCPCVTIETMWHVLLLVPIL